MPRHRKPDARTFGQDLMRGEHTLGTSKRQRRLDAVPGGSGGPSEAHRLFSQQMAARHNLDPQTAGAQGTSITDPVLVELCLRWFAPPGGIVWNPFMGESSIGIVASRLGYKYTAVDVRPEQAAANQAQSDIICPAAHYPPPRWLVGDGATADPEDLCRGSPDFVLSCPPFADLEVYSDDPADLSTMPYPKFIEVYRAIIAKCYEALKQDRFACFIVGEVRGDDGGYLGFVPDTIRAFVDAGFMYYNEMILVTACGSLPVRTRRQFEASRKIGKTHQQCLIFLKGDAKLATAAIGPVEFGEGTPDDAAPNP